MTFKEELFRRIRIIIAGVVILLAILGLIIIVDYHLEDKDDNDKEGKYVSQLMIENVKVRERNIRQEAEKNYPSELKGRQESKSIENPMEELNKLVGLESVKKEVESLTNFIKVQNTRQKQGLKTPKISYHLVFTGNPGTGKTTVARIIASIYKDLGVLKKGHLVETDRSGLIGEYVGKTAPKVNQVCDSALGGVLFIDEAYALTQSESKNDYGGEAIATLLKRMEDDRDNLVVIVAGYTDEMNEFLESNPGLKSRFTRFLDFPDYTDEELCKIYLQQMSKYDFVLTSEAEKTLNKYMAEAVANKDRYFGNARYARNLFENTLTAQANRLSRSNTTELVVDDLNRIEKTDVEEAYRQTKK